MKETEWTKIMFLTQISFSLLAISFCMGMIIHDPSTITTSIFLPILTSVLGVWLPQPQHREDSGSNEKSTPATEKQPLYESII